MSRLKETSASVTIHSNKEKVWETLFDQFGDVNNFNPLIQNSNYLDGHSQGQEGCERQCQLDDKTHVLERVQNVVPGEKFDIEIYGGNMPMMGTAIATISVNKLTADITEVGFIMRFKAKPAFMSGLMKSGMTKMINKVLIGLKYYLETGELVHKKDYKSIYRSFKLLEEGAAFTAPALAA